jgi:hypothetical protein
MRIRKFGIELRRLKQKEIELVRNKRNLEEIGSTMLYREHITPEMQAKWFESVNNIYNNYFVIYIDNAAVGLINGKNIDFERRSSEGGMFIWETSLWGTMQPALCSLIMSDFHFIINEFETNYIRILRSNTKAISHNRQLGYEATSDFPSSHEFQWYALSRENYLKHAPKIKKAVSQITSTDATLELSDFDFLDDSEQDMKLLYEPLPDQLKAKINIVLKRDGQKLLTLNER